MDKCILTWEQIVGYYSYRKLKEVDRRETTYFEFNNFIDHVKKLAKNSGIDLIIDEKTYVSPEDYVSKNPSIYLPRQFNRGFDGYSVVPNIAYYDLCQKTMNHMSIMNHHLLKTAYSTFCED